MCEPEPTQRTITLKRRVGYGEYMDADERSEQTVTAMEVDKHVQSRQRLD